MDSFIEEINNIAIQAMRVQEIKPVYNIDFLCEVGKRMGNRKNLYTNINGAECEIEWRGEKYKLTAETVRER